MNGQFQEVIYNLNGGIGIITVGLDEEEFIDKTVITVGGQILQPNQLTTLNGYFNEPIRYCGLQKEQENKIMVFHSGENADLFETKNFYYCVYWINEDRIGNVYALGSLRDFHFKNGQWK